MMVALTVEKLGVDLVGEMGEWLVGKMDNKMVALTVVLLVVKMVVELVDEMDNGMVALTVVEKGGSWVDL